MKGERPLLDENGRYLPHQAAEFLGVSRHTEGRHVRYDMNWEESGDERFTRAQYMATI